MKQLIIAAAIATSATALSTERDYEAMFKEFKSTHLKAYADQAEESARFRYFVSNMKKAEVLQAANPLATFGPNVFSDMSEAEFKTRHNGERFHVVDATAPREAVVLTDVHAAAGEKIDWREKGAVTPIKNQGSCGSCWAFASIGNMEGQWAIAGNPLTVLSEQEIISCDKTNSGCNGGLEYDSWVWLVKNRKGQIVTSSALPYKSGSGSSGSCPSNLDSLEVGATITGYKRIANSEDAMAAFVYASGPLSVGVDATSWQSYRGGIMTNCISRSMDHSVLIVGFDDTNVPPYWIVKNSWGTSWGESGYIRISKGSNQCLIKDDPSSSVV